MNGQLDRLLVSASSVTPEIETLLQERARMRSDCQAKMLRHFFELSQAMPAEQGRRYMSWVREATCLRESPMLIYDVGETESPP